MVIMKTDALYQISLRNILDSGDLVNTRNSLTYSKFDLNPITFTSTPLVTLRRTAWRLAIREMEWFMSGESQCPPELLHWWKDQLGFNGEYKGGYAHQYRKSGTSGSFDQIQYLLSGLRNNPNSRRLVMTTWNPSDMANITELNNNPNTPSCCHGSMIQLFVREGSLFMTHYQRSADMLLGIIHNFIQYWALLMYFAHHAELNVGYLRVIIGDAHVYQDHSHLNVAKEIINCDLSKRLLPPPKLVYNCNGNCDFRSSDFEMIGEIQEPVTTVKPKLF